MSLFDNPSATTEVKFEDLVGEGKKYASAEQAAKALVEKENFIERLKAENAEMRKTITQADKSQEILDRLEALRATPTAEHQPEPQVVERVVENKGITEADVERLLAQREAKAQQARNVEFVKGELVKLYGNNYGDALRSLAQGLGATPEYLENIAATSPQAFLRLVSPAKGPSAFTPPNSRNASEAVSFEPSGKVHKKLSYYKELQATDRAKYFSPAVQNQMYRDAMALAEEFYDVS